MDSEEYFQRVIRFLETKGWNTSTTQVNESVYIVTGTRTSETYYDRMMTMVGVGRETIFDEKHLDYLVDAAGEHDVDQLLATCRGGVAEESTALLGEYDIEFIDPETIDDAFIDEFEVEREDGLFGQARAAGTGLPGLGTDRFKRSAGSLLSLYLFSAALFALEIAVFGFFTGTNDPLPALLAGSLVLVGPLLALVGALALIARETPSEPSPLGVLTGAIGGYLLFVMVVGASGGVVGVTASTGLFGSTAMILAVFGLSVPTGLGAVGVAYAYLSLRGSAAS